MPCTAAPCAVPSTYVGCFTEPKQGPDVDVYQRPMSFINGSTDWMTIDICVTQARNQQYKYAAVQDGSQCFASQNISLYVNTSCTGDTCCRTPCYGNRGQTCGGPWQNQIYKLGEGNATGCLNGVVLLVGHVVCCICRTEMMVCSWHNIVTPCSGNSSGFWGH